MDAVKQNELKKFALQIRIGVAEQIKARGFGHIGGSLSVADALAVLYGDVMRYDPENPKWEERDKLVCSKGHAGPAVYAALALKGFFPYEELKSLNQPGTNLPSHCDRQKTVGVDMTTGSLGQGTSLAAGIALGDRIKGRDSKTYLIVGDGECNEGQVWEAAMFASAKKLTNLVWLIDENKKQLDGYTRDVLDTADLRVRFEAFGFEALRINGNDVTQIHEALIAPVGDRPRAIILDTVKGYGIADVAETFGNHSMTVGPDVCEGWITALKDELAQMG